MSVAEDVAIPVALAIVASGVAFFWPWFQSYHRGRRFRYLIQRELAEATPLPDEPTAAPPWFERLQRKFLHRDIIENVTQNRDFILSLDADLVYKVSQLWNALKDEDHVQWMYCLGRLTQGSAATGGLSKGCRKWAAIMDVQHPSWREEVSREERLRSSTRDDFWPDHHQFSSGITNERAESPRAPLKRATSRSQTGSGGSTRARDCLAVVVTPVHADGGRAPGYPGAIPHDDQREPPAPGASPAQAASSAVRVDSPTEELA